MFLLTFIRFGLIRQKVRIHWQHRMKPDGLLTNPSSLSEAMEGGAYGWGRLNWREMEVKMDGWMTDDGWMMDGWMDRWMDRWMDGWWTDGWMDEWRMMDGWWMDGWWTDWWIDGWMMDGWMDGWMDDGWMMDGWMDGWMDRWTEGWMDGWMDGWMMDRLMDWWMDRWMHGWMDEWTDGWMDGWWMDDLREVKFEAVCSFHRLTGCSLSPSCCERKFHTFKTQNVHFVFFHQLDQNSKNQILSYFNLNQLLYGW